MRKEIRTPEEIADIINNHHYYENNLGALEAYLMTDFTVGEIRVFAKFLRGEDWSRYDPEWHRDTSKYITLEWLNFDDLTSFVDHLVRICYLYMGAASVLKIKGSQLLGVIDITDLHLLDLTLRELVHAVPEEYRKQLDAASKLDTILAKTARIEAQGAEIKAQGEEVKKIVVEKKAETEKRLAAQDASTRKQANALKIANAEIDRLRGNGAK